MEFGLRRAQGPDAGTFGARAAVIGGCIGTSNVICAKEYDVPALGTHAHSWIMSYGDELTAFRKYAELYPNNTTPVSYTHLFHKLSRKVCASWALPLNKRVRVSACKIRNARYPRVCTHSPQIFS